MIMETALVCLALNLYHESRGEPISAQVAVAETTLNRVNSKHYPDTVCGVVTQSGGGSCSFSWFCDGLSDRPKDLTAFNRSIELSRFMLSEGQYIEVIGDEALFYHNHSVEPYWLTDVTLLGEVGGHKFYKKK